MTRRLLLLPIDEIEGAEQNPKRHDRAALDRSFGEFGFVEPMVRDDRTGRLVAGHGRLDALRDALGRGEPPPDGVTVKGGRWHAPVLVGWSSADDAQAAAYLVASNRLGELGGWDQTELAALLDGLTPRLGLLEAAGWQPDELAALLAETTPRPALTDPDDAPPLQQGEPITHPGDLWELGPHRLLCGDAANRDDHERVLNGRTADLVLTDPPYGVGLDYGPETDDDPATIRELVVDRVMPLLLTHPRILITTGHRLMWDYPPPTWLLAWVHPAGMGAGPWGFTCYNPVLAYGPDPYLERGLGRRPDTLILADDRRKPTHKHPAAKPVEVWRWLIIRGSALTTDLIFDPFAGSGTTIIAAHGEGRPTANIEISSAWCDVICRRFQAHTGEKPTRDGQPHDFTQSDRP